MSPTKKEEGLDAVSADNDSASASVPVQVQDSSSAECVEDMPPSKKPKKESKEKRKKKKKAKSKSRASTPPPQQRTPEQPEVELEKKEPEPKFEDLFHNPRLQKAAFNMLNSFLDDNARKKSASYSNGGVPARTTRATVDFEEKSIFKATSDAAAVKGAGAGDGRFEVDQESADMVNALLKRYDNARKEKRRKKVKDFEFNNSDDELAFVLSDDDDEISSRDGFMKLCVQDYDVKVKLFETHCNVIRSMSGRAVEDLGKTVLSDLDDIMMEVVPNERHAVFKGCGLSKSKLREMTVSEPFTDKQEHHIVMLLENRLSARYNLTDNNGELLHYISNVLVPEALIRIYAKANQIDLDLAEKELRYGGKYDGKVPPELLQGIQLQP